MHEHLQTAETANGEGAALPLVVLARNWSCSYDDNPDRNRADRDTYVAGRRGILALKQRGLVMIRREAGPVDLQPSLVELGCRFRRLDMVHLTPAGRDRYWLAPPSSIAAQNASPARSSEG